MDAITGLYQSHKYIPLAIVLAYGALVYGSSKISWLQQGKRAAVIAGLVGAFATIAQTAASGKTPSLGDIALAVGAAVALYLHPVPQSAPAPAK